MLKCKILDVSPSTVLGSIITVLLRSRVSLTGIAIESDGPDDTGDVKLVLTQDSSPFRKGQVVTVKCEEIESFAFAREDSSCVPPPPGLISWWPGDGNANDIVDSNPGTLFGDVDFCRGEVKRAFCLNGIDAFVDFGNASNLHVSSGDFTVDAWVKFNALSHPPGANFGGAPQGDMSILDKMSGTTNTDGWRLLKQDDNHFWFCFGGSPNGCTAFTPTTVRSLTVATTGVFFHVAAVKSGLTIQIFVNGLLENVSVMPGFVDTNSTNLLLGANAPTGARLNGVIDEAEIFNRALSPAEIFSIFAAGSAGKCKK